MSDERTKGKKAQRFKVSAVVTFVAFAFIILDVCFPMVLVNAFDLDNSPVATVFESVGLMSTKQRHARNPNTFDVLKGLETATDLADGLPLMAFTATEVTRSGTVDLNTSEVTYTFGRPTKEESSMGYVVWLEMPGSFMHTHREISTMSAQNLGFEGRPLLVKRQPIADPPKCDLKTLWDVAVKAGASESQNATVRYDAGGYRFTLNDSQLTLKFWSDCTPKRA